MKKFIVGICLLLPVLSFAQGLTAQSSGAKTNVTVISNTRDLRARRIFPIMKGDDGEIVNDGGIIGDKVSTDAIDLVAKSAADMSEAAHTAMTNSLKYVNDAMKHMAKDSVGIAIAFPPDTEVSNLTCYVAHETTDRTNDTFYVWLSENLRLAPNIFMSYEYYGGAVTQRLDWIRGWNETTNVVDRRGQTWENCHIGRCKRPSWAINITCITEPNLPIGGPNGMNWGGVTLIDADDGQPYFTGYITNLVDHQIMYCEDGAIKDLFYYIPEE